MNHAATDISLCMDFEADYLLWLDTQRELLHSKQFEQLDLANLLEELGDMASYLRHELRFRLEVLIMHLLKCEFQPAQKSTSWLATIAEQRSQIGQRLEQSPSLRSMVADYVQRSYKAAVRRAVIDTGLTVANFPPNNPYSVEQLLDDDFIP